MTIFAEDKKSGIQCGVNDLGDLFLGNGRSGYNLPNTPENREYILADFSRFCGRNREPDRRGSGYCPE